MPIGRKVGSMKTLKDSLKKGGNGTFIKYVPKDGAITVRFLQEPEEWMNYFEHYDTTLRKSYPCIEDNCPGCMTDERRSSRYLANALDVENDRVIPMQMPKTLVSALVAMYDRLDTLTDRDFELIRSGEGLDTTYNAIPEAPTPRKISKYESSMHDLQVVLDEAYNSVFNASAEVAEEVAVKPRKKSAAAAKAAPAVAEAEDDLDEDEDVPVETSPANFKADVEDEDEDPEVDEPAEALDEEGGYYTEADLKLKPLGELRAIARDYKINTKGLNKVDLIEAILTPEEED